MQAQPGGAQFDTIIIGCGMAGLAAGIRLAQFDRKVLIVEKHTVPGGLNSFYAIAGRKFDVGLHAVTNFADPQAKGTPLSVLIRQLRLPRDAFGLAPQSGSRIAFPGVDLRFANGFQLLEAEVAREFPAAIDGFRALRQAVLDFTPSPAGGDVPSARQVLEKYIRNPLLREMLLCPLMYYGSSTELDMAFPLFVTLWKSVFEEGFGRPLDGIRAVIRVLVDRFKELGGVRRMGCGVRRILVDGRRAGGVELENGEVLLASHILSTVGWPETRILCGTPATEPSILANTGRLSFAETISVLSRQPAGLGCDETIVFFNDGERFQYHQAADPVDLRSGVVCFPNNYRYAQGRNLGEGILRVTSIASHRIWTGYDETTYRREKDAWFPRMVASAMRFLPGMREADVSRHTVFRDMFTPRTIQKFTGHLGGAVYGAPHKSPDGRTGLENLYLAGTDQGLLGIVGALFSGVAMANRHILMPAKQQPFPDGG